MERDYKIYHYNDYRDVKWKEDDIIPCESCSCEVATSPYDWGPPFTEEHQLPKRHLCSICASTNIGNLTRYKSGYSGDTRTLGIIIAQVGNIILERMK